VWKCVTCNKNVCWQTVPWQWRRLGLQQLHTVIGGHPAEGMTCCSITVFCIASRSKKYYVCPNTSRSHPLRLFSKVGSRLSSSGVPSHDFYHNFCTVSIFRHFNRYFFNSLTLLMCVGVKGSDSTMLSCVITVIYSTGHVLHTPTRLWVVTQPSTLHRRAKWISA